MRSALTYFLLLFVCLMTSGLVSAQNTPPNQADWNAVVRVVFVQMGCHCDKGIRSKIVSPERAAPQLVEALASLHAKMFDHDNIPYSPAYTLPDHFIEIRKISVGTKTAHFEATIGPAFRAYPHSYGFGCGETEFYDIKKERGQWHLVEPWHEMMC